MSRTISPFLALQARAEARARLWREGYYPTFEVAADPLWLYALNSGIVDDIGVDAARSIIEAAFAPHVSPVDGGEA